MPLNEPSPAILTTLIYIALSLMLVACNGFFVAAEFAIVKVRRNRLKELEGLGVKAARISILCVDQLDEYLSATQLGITLVSLGLGWLGEESFFRLFEYLFPVYVSDSHPTWHGIALGTSFFVITLLHVVLGELVPKSMAIQQAEKITLAVARPLHWFYLAAKPVISSFTFLASGILKLIGYGDLEESAMTEEELKMVMKESREEGVISESEAQIINRAFSFSDKRAADIMVPAERVEFLSMQRTLEANMVISESHMFTRFPLTEKGFQEVSGIVHMKDALRELRNTASNDAFQFTARPPVFVDPRIRQDRLMKIFKDKQTHMAIVQDPVTKRNLGIVTLEDILEELVGEITDEHGN